MKLLLSTMFALLLVTASTSISTTREQPGKVSDRSALLAASLAQSQASNQRQLSRLPESKGTYIVQFEHASWVDQNRAGSKTEPRTAGVNGSERKASIESFEKHWRSDTDRQLANIKNRLGRTVATTAQFPFVFSGVALRLSDNEARDLALLPGVKSIQKEMIFRHAADIEPQWVNATSVWNMPVQPFNKGEGTTLAIIDSGITPGQSSFAGTTQDGYSFPAVSLKGLCTSSGRCTNKLYGMYDFTNGSTNREPDDGTDVSGHGTLVADIALGNARYTNGVPISGIAPRARLISYKACEAGVCSGSWILSAVNQAVADGVDVINISLAGTESDPWTEPTMLALKQARSVGIVVVTAAGNSGPGVATLGSPGNAPWVITVGNTTSPRVGQTFTTNTALADIVNASSSRGPSLKSPGLGKPDITAPGTNVLAQFKESLYMATGTSNATPHVSGAALLLKAQHPSWDDDRISSALITGVSASVKLDSIYAATVFETGAGRLDAAMASEQSLSFPATGSSEGQQDFDKANPSKGGAPNQINRPSLVDDNCSVTCSWTRTVTDTGSGGSWKVQVEVPSDVTITVTPSQFSLPPNGQRNISFTLNALQTGTGNVPGWAFGRIRLARTDVSGKPSLIMPVAANIVKRGSPAPQVIAVRVPVSGSLSAGQTLEWAVSVPDTQADYRVFVRSSGPVTIALYRSNDPNPQYLGGIGKERILWKSGLLYQLKVTNNDSASVEVHASVDTFSTTQPIETPKD